MYLYLTILIFISTIFSIEPDVVENSSDCLTDELYGGFTIEEYNNLVKRRINVREFINKNLHRNELDILYVPVVFHNLYKIADGETIHSYCDYIKGSRLEGEYIMGNDQNICNQRMLRSLEILNSQYLLSGIQFELHPNYHEMLHDTITGYDGFFDNATGNNLPNANDIKSKYNIQYALNIYTTDCIGSGNNENYTTCRSSVYGFSLYPNNLSSIINKFIKSK